MKRTSDEREENDFTSKIENFRRECGMREWIEMWIDLEGINNLL